MSIIAEKHVKGLRGLKAAGWRVAMALADAHNGKTGLCCPSVDVIAERAGMSRRNAFRVLANLKSNDIIREVHRTSRYQSTHYKFVNLGGDKTGAGGVTKMDQGGDKTGIKGVTTSSPKHGNEQGINKEDNGEDKTKVKTSSISSSVSVKPTPPAPAVTQGNGDDWENDPESLLIIGAQPTHDEFLKVKGKDITVDRLIDLYHRGCLVYEYKYQLDQKGKDQMTVFIKEFGDQAPALIGFMLGNWSKVATLIFLKGEINQHKYGEAPKKPYFGMVMKNRKLIRDFYNRCVMRWKQATANQATADTINESAPAGQLILSPTDIELYGDFRGGWPSFQDGFEQIKLYLSDKEKKAQQVAQTLPFTREFGQDTKKAVYAVTQDCQERFIELVGSSPELMTVEFVCSHLKEARQVFGEYQTKQAAFKNKKSA